MVKHWNSNTARVGLSPLPGAVRANMLQHSGLRGSWSHSRRPQLGSEQIFTLPSIKATDGSFVDPLSTWSVDHRGDQLTVS